MDVVYIDKEDGIKRVMNNVKLYARLLDKFYKGADLTPVFSAIEDADYTKAQELVHTIKGVTANLSIKDLNEKMIRLEAQIKAKSVDAQFLEAVKDSFAKTIPEIKKVIAEYA